MLQVEYVPITSIKPYKQNAKRHTREQIDQIKKSIEEFGFRDPIGVWKNEIVEGHGRHIAAQELGMTEVPIIRLDDLTDEQRRAYVLVHNQLTMNTGWDEDTLAQELSKITALDMTDFGFLDVDFEEDSRDYFERSQKLRTDNAYNLLDYDADRIAGKYEMPVVKALHEMPEGEFLGFKDIPATKRRDMIIHFYMDDYRFERFWDQPQVYMDKLSEFRAVVSPDFSIYTDMPVAMQIWNTYRNRLLSQMMQDQGIIVIPSINYGFEKTYEFAFDGLEPGGIYCRNTLSCVRDAEGADMWKKGMDEAIKRLKPEALIIYGKIPEGYDFQGVPVTNVPARSFYTDKPYNKKGKGA